MTLLVKAWVATYWELGKELKVVGYEKAAPEAEAVNSDNPASGWYRPTDHSVTINVASLSKKGRDHLLKVLRKRNADALETELQKSEGWGQFFAYGFPSSTLAHELEHARRGGSHESGGHDSTSTPLFPDDVAQTRSFDQATNVIYAKILSGGFYEGLFRRRY